MALFIEPFSVREVLSEDDLVRRYVEHVLKHYDGNKSRAADALGMDRASLYRRLAPKGSR